MVVSVIGRKLQASKQALKTATSENMICISLCNLCAQREEPQTKTQSM
jgi:hypothetical protein